MTSSLLRNLHNEFFGGCDKYFTPFISTNENYLLNHKEQRDVDPANNEGLKLVPQIITNSAHQSAEYLYMIHEKYGYEEVNINMGCPSGCVVSKDKGSGMLRSPDALEDFMADLEKEIHEVRPEGTFLPDVSIKTRIGYYSEDEHKRLTEIFMAHPVKQIIIHPRFRNQMYKGEVHLDEFGYMYDAFTDAGIGVVYNGDINTKEDYDRIADRFPKLDGVMIGRGLLRDPSLARQIKGGEKAGNEEYLGYMEAVLDGYAKVIPSEKNVLAKVKDLWNFAKPAFSGNDKGYKDMCKADSLESFRVCMRQFVRNSVLD
ncbi:MAG: tRNA-dihydrouridine synthase family protein [Lachnospiraceae bacterium]|nr:tRNA-dihydrouridine synthase family protein [Lachnospiraceae bacterium]